MRHIQPFKAGIAVGAVVGLFHLVWASFVAAGWAKPIMDFVLRLHFVRLQYDIAPFAAGTALALIALTFAVGFLFGFVFAAIWNWLAAAPGSSAAGAPAGI